MSQRRDQLERAIRRAAGAAIQAGQDAEAEEYLELLDQLLGRQAPAPAPTSAPEPRRAPKSGAERQAAVRARRRAGAPDVTVGVTANVTEVTKRDDESVTRVTKCDAPNVTEVTKRDAPAVTGGIKGGVSFGSDPEEYPKNSEKNTPRAREDVTLGVTKRDGAASPAAAFEASVNGSADAFMAAVGRTSIERHEYAQLAKLLDAAPPGVDAIAWMAAEARAYASKTDANFWRRTPARLLTWIESGRPEMRAAPVPRDAPVVQRKHTPKLTAAHEPLFDPEEQAHA